MSPATHGTRPKTPSSEPTPSPSTPATLTDAERQQRRLKVIQLIRAGYTYHDVAEMTGLTPGGVSQIAARTGLARTPGRVGRIDPALIEKAKQRYLDGASLAAVGREFGLSRVDLFRLGPQWRADHTAREQARVREWVDAYESGKSIKDIAAGTPHSAHHIGHVLRQALNTARLQTTGMRLLQRNGEDLAKRDAALRVDLLTTQISQRELARKWGLHRETVHDFLLACQEAGLLPPGPRRTWPYPPTPAQLTVAQQPVRLITRRLRGKRSGTPPIPRGTGGRFATPKGGVHAAHPAGDPDRRAAQPRS